MTGIRRELSDEFKNKVESGAIPQAKVDAYHRLLDRVEKEILPHPVITNNQYTAWFEKGDLSLDHTKHFLIQFSVFSNLFLEAQLKKVINAPTLEAMHAGKEILLNELGVAFRKVKPGERGPADPDVDPSLVGTEGTIEGGTFKFAAAHFEWLLRMLSHLDLTYDDVGKRKHGTKSTLFFCDELSRLYGSEDPNVGLGASFAVENWAAAGFWKQLISGLESFKKHHAPKMPLAFFTWHDRVEDQHAEHTWDELEEDFFENDVDPDRFISGGREMLDGVQAFWTGLNEDRKSIP